MRFSNYFNKRSNRNRIYSHNNILRMNVGEFLDREDELDYQNNLIGFPDDEELKSSPNIEAYTDNLGNQGWRSKLGLINNIENTLNQTNSDIPINTQPKVYEGGISYLEKLPPMSETLKNMSGYNNEGNDNSSKNNLGEKFKDYARDHFKAYRDYEGLTVPEKAQKFAAKHIPSWIPTEYYGLGLELADDGQMSEKRAQNNDIYNVSDIQDEEKAKFIRAKIEEARRLNPNGPYTNTPVDDVKVVVPKDDSPIMKQIKNSPAFEDFVVKNYEKLKNRKGESINTSMQFPLSGDKDDKALGATIHNTDMGVRVNNDGSMSGELRDVMDYSYLGDNEKRPTMSPIDFLKKGNFDKESLYDFVDEYLYNATVDANNRAYYQQKAGKYEPYFFNKEFNLSEEEIEEMYERWRRRKGK